MGMGNVGLNERSGITYYYDGYPDANHRFYKVNLLWFMDSWVENILEEIALFFQFKSEKKYCWGPGAIIDPKNMPSTLYYNDGRVITRDQAIAEQKTTTEEIFENLNEATKEAVEGAKEVSETLPNLIDQMTDFLTKTPQRTANIYNFFDKLFNNELNKEKLIVFGGVLLIIAVIVMASNFSPAKIATDFAGKLKEKAKSFLFSK